MRRKKLAIYHIKYPRGGERFGVIDDDADAGTIQKIVRADMTKGRPTTPARAAPVPRQQQATRLAMARATDAIEAIKAAERSGDRFTIQRAKADGELVKRDLAAASAHEKALAAMRGALAKPLRIF